MGNGVSILTQICTLSKAVCCCFHDFEEVKPSLSQRGVPALQTWRESLAMPKKTIPHSKPNAGTQHPTSTWISSELRNKSAVSLGPLETIFPVFCGCNPSFLQTLGTSTAHVGMSCSSLYMLSLIQLKHYHFGGSCILRHADPIHAISRSPYPWGLHG